MMKSLALLLFLANIIVFGYWFSYAPPVQSAPLQKPLSPPESLRLSLLSEKTDNNWDESASDIQVSSITLDDTPEIIDNNQIIAPVSETEIEPVAQQVQDVIEIADNSVVETPEVPAQENAVKQILNETELADQILDKLATEAVINKVDAITEIEISPQISNSTATPSTLEHEQIVLPDNTATLGFSLPETVLNILLRIGDIRFTHIHPRQQTDEMKKPPVVATLLMTDAVVKPEKTKKIKTPAPVNTLRTQLSALNKTALSMGQAPPNPFAMAIAKTQAVTGNQVPKTASLVDSQQAKPIPLPSVPVINTPSKKSQNVKKKSTLNQTLCYRTGLFPTQAAVERAERWLSLRRIKTQVRKQGKRVKVNTRIYLAPYPSLQNARYAAQQLRRNAVSDVRILMQGALKHAISLGVYSKQSSVQRRLTELRNKGYFDIKVKHRYQGEERFWLKIRLLKTQQAILNNFVKALKILKPQKIKCS